MWAVGPPDVIHQPSTDRGVLGDGERTESAAVERSEMTAIGQRREVGELSDQRPVPRDERTGMDEHDTLAPAVAAR